MNINEQNIIDLIARIESDAAGGIAADPQDAERLAATATDQLDGMLLLLGTAGVEIGGKLAWERTVAEIPAAIDPLLSPSPGGPFLRAKMNEENDHLQNPFIGQRVLVRTYSAGVHIGTLEQASGKECLLRDALRLWRWTGGGLSLSAVANNGIKGGRLNRTCQVFLTEAIEYIPITDIAWESYERFIEN